MLGLQAPEEYNEVRLPPGREEQGATVLVIDDEAALLAIISEVLEEGGYQVVAVPDGPAGLDVIRSGQPIDLLLTDIRLPKGMNGRQVAEAARDIRPQIKVLFMTGYAGSVLDDTAEVMIKPFDLNRLADRVRRLIEG